MRRIIYLAAPPASSVAVPVLLREDIEWALELAKQNAHDGDQGIARLDAYLAATPAPPAPSSDTAGAEDADVQVDVARLMELHADAGYLFHRVQQGSMMPDAAAAAVRSKIATALAAPPAPSVADAAGAKPCEVCDGVDKIGTPGQRCFGCEGSGQSKFAAIAKESGNDVDS
ncbi:hypothetical protein BRPE67_DCDS08520 (plasmid) [Caballeronia cordobensis]|nr:hypothetical protein BRPE67_DCDS08520 [Burkholderia sp. RPE67]